jgi:hypothetical protein
MRALGVADISPRTFRVSGSVAIVLISRTYCDL